MTTVMSKVEMQEACAILYAEARNSVASGDLMLALSYQHVARMFHQMLMVTMPNAEAYL